jgi:hypothetical protein
VKFELSNFSVIDGKISLEITTKEIEAYYDYSSLTSYIEFSELNGNRKMITRIARADTNGIINIFRMGSYDKYISKINQFFDSDLVYAKVFIVVKNEQTRDLTIGNIYNSNKKVIFNIQTGDILL